MAEQAHSSPIPGLDPFVLELRKFHENGLDKIRKRHQSGVGGLQIVDETTGLMDQLVMRAWQHSMREASRVRNIDFSRTPPEVCLVAIGGYGRAQLHPKSDVDILFLHGKKIRPGDEEVIKISLRSLWDVGLDIGHATRTVADCIRIASEDLDSRTALLENRYLCGSRSLYENFHRRYRAFVGRVGKQNFIRQKEEERRKRYLRFGDTVAVQEPNLKESAGGLRDLHHAIWLAIAMYDIPSLAGIRRIGLVHEPFYGELCSAVDFLLRIRNELHLILNTSSNRLTFEVQEAVASSFRYFDEGINLAEESLMRDYYAAATRIQQFADRMTDHCLRPTPLKALKNYWHRQVLEGGYYLCGGVLSVHHPETFFLNRVDRIVGVLEIFQECGCVLDSEMYSEITRALDTTTVDDIAQSREIGKRIITMLGKKGRVGPLIRMMSETGFLELMIPELRVIRFLPRRDLYHRYTVDEHSIITTEILDALADEQGPLHPCMSIEEMALNFPAAKRKWRWWGVEPVKKRESAEDIDPSKDVLTLPIFSQSGESILKAIRNIFANVEKPEVLYLATFLHDVGKGRGGDHHVKGAAIAAEVCRRLALNESDADLVVFLVERHLELAKIAFRFDTSDFGTVQEFASWCDTRTKLDYLYLLTIADIWGVNTDLLTEWKMTMLHQFYTEVSALLEDREEAEAKRLAEEKEAYINFLAMLPRDITETEVERHLGRMPTSYLTKQPEDTIHHHLRLLRRFTGDAPLVGCRQTMHNILEVVTIQPNRIGNFMRVARALTSLNLSISQARIFVRDDGVAFNTLAVVHQEGFSLGDDIIQRVINRTTSSLLDKWEDSWNPKVQPIPERGRFRFPVHVEVYNKVSPQYTVVEVRCADAIGVLVRITSVLAKYGLDIRFARIHTEGKRVFDTFYVIDQDRLKYEDPQKINWLKASVKKALSDIV